MNEQQKRYAELQRQVDLQKKKTHPPENTKLDETHGMRNVVEISENIDDILPILNEKAKIWQDFADRVKKQAADAQGYCEEHEDQLLEIDLDKTLSATWFDENKEFQPCFKQCPQCRKVIDDLLVNESRRSMGIPEKTRNATFDNFITDTDKKERVLERTKSFLRRGRGFLLFRGTPGAGKTHLASAILNFVGAGIFVTQGDLLAEYRRGYQDQSIDKEAIVEKYRNCKVLVLDELTDEVKGVDIAQLLYRILAHRYDVGLLTVITSNEKLEVVLDILGPRLADRFKECYYVGTFDWESYRGKQVS